MRAQGFAFIDWNAACIRVVTSWETREDHARALGRSHVAFCSVRRPDDHPAKPVGARSNDDFWRKRGYAPMPGVQAEFSWKDIGLDAETKKPLQFWMRAL